MQMMNLDGGTPSRAAQAVQAQQAPQPATSQATPVQKSASSGGSENAILVNKELIIKLKNLAARGLRPLEELPTTRDMVNFVVSEMGDSVRGLYSTLAREECYKWFDSEVAKRVQSMDDIKDKGRFVDACLIAYGWGVEALKKYCVSKIVVGLPPLGNDEKDQMKQIASEMGATRGKLISLRPAASFEGNDNP